MPAYYIQFSATGLMAGAGYYAMATDQLARFRAAVDAEATGSEVAMLAADAAKRGYSIGAIGELKSAPRGFSKDHPRIELLRRKGLIAVQEFGAPAWIHGEHGAEADPRVVGRTCRICADGSTPTSARAPCPRRPRLLTRAKRSGRQLA